MVVCCGCGWLCWDAVILSIAAVLITLVWLFVGRGQSGDLIAEEQSAAARDEEYGKDGINDGVDENNIYGTMPDSRPKADDDVRVVVATDEEDLLLANNANKNINNTSNNNGGKRPVNAAEEKSSRGDSGNNINVHATPQNGASAESGGSFAVDPVPGEGTVASGFVEHALDDQEFVEHLQPLPAEATVAAGNDNNEMGNNDNLVPGGPNSMMGGPGQMGPKNGDGTRLAFDPRAPSEEPGQAVRDCHAKTGKLGISVEWPSGRVTNVKPDGQGAKSGITVGEYLYAISGNGRDDRATRENLRKAMQGAYGSDYRLTLYPSNPDDDSSDHMNMNSLEDGGGGGDGPQQEAGNGMFYPGSLGMAVNWDTGKIMALRKGGQAERIGMKETWMVVEVAGEAYTEERLIAAAQGAYGRYNIVAVPDWKWKLMGRTRHAFGWGMFSKKQQKAHAGPVEQASTERGFFNPNRGSSFGSDSDLMAFLEGGSELTDAESETVSWHAMFRQWTEGPSEHASARTRGGRKHQKKHAHEDDNAEDPENPEQTTTTTLAEQPLFKFEEEGVYCPLKSFLEGKKLRTSDIRAIFGGTGASSSDEQMRDPEVRYKRKRASKWSKVREQYGLKEVKRTQPKLVAGLKKMLETLENSGDVPAALGLQDPEVDKAKLAALHFGDRDASYNNDEGSRHISYGAMAPEKLKNLFSDDLNLGYNSEDDDDNLGDINTPGASWGPSKGKISKASTPSCVSATVATTAATPHRNYSGAAVARNSKGFEKNAYDAPDDPEWGIPRDYGAPGGALRQQGPVTGSAPGRDRFGEPKNSSFGEPYEDLLDSHGSMSGNNNHDYSRLNNSRVSNQNNVAAAAANIAVSPQEVEQEVEQFLHRYQEEFDLGGNSDWLLKLARKMHLEKRDLSQNLHLPLPNLEQHLEERVRGTTFALIYNTLCENSGFHKDGVTKNSNLQPGVMRLKKDPSLVRSIFLRQYLYEASVAFSKHAKKEGLVRLLQRSVLESEVEEVRYLFPRIAARLGVRQQAKEALAGSVYAFDE